jgi:hypothetical protein
LRRGITAQETKRRRQRHNLQARASPPGRRELLPRRPRTGADALRAGRYIDRKVGASRVRTAVSLPTVASGR